MFRGYALGDLVLAKVQRRPFWPALIQKCHLSGDSNIGEWHIDQPNAQLWCVFLDSFASQWVEVKAVKKFVQKDAEYSLARTKPEMKKRLSEAIEKAVLMQADTPEPALDGPPAPYATPPAPLSSSSEEEMDESHMQHTIPLLDDLVLAKTGTYPYWPAVVAKCISEKKKWNNRWLLFATDRKPVRVWCSFVGDSTGSWVPAFRIRPFVPDFLDSTKPKSRLHDELRKAMEEATRMHRAKRRLKVPAPPGAAAAAMAKAAAAVAAPKPALTAPPTVTTADMAATPAVTVSAVATASPVAPSKPPATDARKTPAIADSPAKETPSTPVKSTATPARTIKRPTLSSGAGAGAGRARAGSTTSPAASTVPVNINFELGDLVLAKYDSSCPYWPAIIRECADADADASRRGLWRLPAEKPGDMEHFCCYFIKDGSEAWVAPVAIKEFSAARARSYLCHKSSGLYEVQREAIFEAAKLHKKRSAARNRGP